jgi:predicted enzyme related to lactoylglutathione lyase
MDLELNFMGVAVADWQTSSLFYTDMLGLGGPLEPKCINWAAMSGWWDKYHAGAKNLVFELVDVGRPVLRDRAWGKGQGVRPSIQVENLEKTIDKRRSRGVLFTSEIETVAWGRRIEFVAPEGVRWSLSQAPGRPFITDLASPLIGHFEIKAYHLERQKTFYGNLLGMTVESADPNHIIFSQGSGQPWIVLEAGGQRPAHDPAWAHKPTRGQPVFMSFTTSNIELLAKQLRSVGVTVLKELEYYPDCDGAKLLVADADGNVVQIVQHNHL